MGAPKQKWMFLEEVALKAGVAKHGAGKWRTILKDPEFSGVLQLRSNVDLKDKWRNMSAMLNGSGSREKARLARKRVHQAPKDETSVAITTVDHTGDDDDAGDIRPLPSSSDSPHTSGSKKFMIRLDHAIMEALNNFKESCGSKNTLCAYIEERYWAPPNFKRLLSMKLKFLTQNGKLIKTKTKYRIVSSDKKNVDRCQKGDSSEPRVYNDETSVSTKSQIDFEPQKMRSMSAHEAVAAAAAQAVAEAEAEAAIVEAEEAARVAEAAEADAEAIKAFTDAAMKAFNRRTTHRLMIRS